MLSSIGWRVNPPTKHCFLRKLLQIIPSNLLDGKTKENVMQLAEYQINLAVCDYRLSLETSSCVAFASLLNSIEAIEGWNASASSFLHSIASSVLRTDEMELRRTRSRLQEAVLCSEKANDPLVELLTQKASYSKPFSTRHCHHGGVQLRILATAQ